MRQLKHRLKRLFRRNRATPQQPTPPRWDYKVVQLVAQTPEDPEKASRRLGGRLSAEALRDQFPEHYATGNGRQQIQEFLNRLGADGWELVETTTIGGLPLMLFKRRAQLPTKPNGAMTDSESSPSHHASTRD